MGAASMCARSGLRGRVATTVALTVLASVAGGIVLAAVAGARRTDSAFPRFLEATNSPDVLLQVPQDKVDQIAALPSVSDVAPFGGMAVKQAGTDALIGYDSISFAGTDERFGTVIGRPLVLEGRLADPGNVHEVTITDGYAADVGDEITIESLTPEQYQSTFSDGGYPEPDGPRVRARVVGVVRTGLDLSTNAGQEGFYVTPAFYRRYRDQIGNFTGVVAVDLDDDAAGVPAFERDLARLFDGQAPGFGTRADDVQGFRRASNVAVQGLLIFAAIAALAAGVAVGQALSRHVAAGADDRAGLAALGMTTAQLTRVGVLAAAPVALGAAAMAAVVAVLLSPIFPVGVMRRAEPDPGLRLDVPVLVGGALLIAATLLAGAALSAWLAARGSTRGAGHDVTQARRSSKVGGWLARHGAPAPTVTGVGLALERGRGRSSIPARSVLAGAIGGAVIVVATFTFVASLDHLLASPRLFGQPFDGSALPGTDPADARRDAATIAGDPGSDAVTLITSAVVSLDGHPTRALGFDAVEGAPLVTVVAGRLPREPAEALLGSRVMRDLHLEIGDTVEIGQDGSRVTVVGQGLFPEDSDHDYDDGALLTRQGARAVAGPPEELSIWYRAEPGRAATLRRQIEGQIGPVTEAGPPPQFVNLDAIASVPYLLAAFVVVIVSLAVAQGLVLTVRRRRRELAVLRVVGFSSGQVRHTVAWQATTPMALALVLGVPLGLALGHWLWSLLADTLGVSTEPTIPVVALALLVPGALLLANLIAGWPGRAAARIAPAMALRSE